MNRFKKGDLLLITANTSNHGFEIGEEVTIITVIKKAYKVKNKSDDYWWVNDKDITLIWSI